MVPRGQMEAGRRVGVGVGAGSARDPVRDHQPLHNFACVFGTHRATAGGAFGYNEHRLRALHAPHRAINPHDQ